MRWKLHLGLVGFFHLGSLSAVDEAEWGGVGNNVLKG